MKHNFVAGLVVALAASAALAGPDAKDAKKPAAQNKQMCAVMQHEIGKIDKDTTRSVYQGKTYYFCCAGCKPTFDKNPAKYVKADAKPAKLVAPEKKKS